MIVEYAATELSANPDEFGPLAVEDTDFTA